MRSKPRAWVDTTGLSEQPDTTTPVIKMAKNLSKLMPSQVCHAQVARFSGKAISFSRSLPPRLIVCFRALFKLMGNLSPSVPHLYWATLF